MNRGLRTESSVLRKLLLSIVGISVLALPVVLEFVHVVQVHAQSQINPNTAPSFEDAAIRPSKPGQPGKGAGIQGNRLRAVNITLNDLIAGAYGISPRQVIGIPPWAGTDKFDIEIKPEGDGSPGLEQWQGMLQKLIADRFKLSFHREKKEIPVYILSVARSGPKLTRSLNPNGLPGSRFGRLGNMHISNMTMDFFAQWMQLVVLDRPVVDQTGLEGRFDFDLNWTPDDSQFASWRAYIPPPVEGVNAPPPLYTAIQEQIGLKLDATNAPAELLVIDHVEKPSEK
jgi:uncharacterized protein (TIGR03435 family)